MHCSVIFVFCAIFALVCKGVYANDVFDEAEVYVLKPLVFPTEVDDDGNENLLKTIFKKLGLGFFKVDHSSLQSSAFYKLYSYFPSRSMFSLSSYFQEDPYKDACYSESPNDGGPTQVTKYGRDICFRKCKAENTEYIEFLNNKLSGLISLLAKEQRIVAVLAPNFTNISQCTQNRFFRGFSCSCQQNYTILVNAKLQDMFTKMLNGRTNEVKGLFSRAIETKENAQQFSFFTKFVGFLIILHVCPLLTPVYILWWIIFS